MSLIVYTGPMFSGKTTKLIHHISRYTDISKENRALIINNAKDNRDPLKIVSSHSSLYKGLNEKIDVISSHMLSSVDIEKYIVIGVDECNFFSDLEDTIKVWLSKGKHIVCVGLDGDYRMEKFGKIHNLLHLSDKFEKLSAICHMCLNRKMEAGEILSPDNITPASFTLKIVDDGIIEDVGGQDKYIAVCRSCHSNAYKTI